MAIQTARRRKVHILCYTHWDREFRWEFERTRMRLVDCMDRLLQIMRDKPEYRSFLLDGQSVMLDDYLEIRPERREEIAGLVRDGRLEIGPWYTLPDCAAVSGESVVRNIMHGVRRARELGDVLKVGYSVFSFGQIAQLPQIYAGFGIDTILFYKGSNPRRTMYHEFLWEAPDGTTALASRLGREARWNFFFAGHIPIVYDMDVWDRDWRYRWGELGKVFHTADPEGHGWFYEILDPETAFHKERVRDGMERALATVEGTAAPGVALMFNGTDFTEPHPLTPEIIAEIRSQCGDELEAVHSTLSEYVRELKEALKGGTGLETVRGPMRDGPVGSIHTDVFSIHPEVMTENGSVEGSVLRFAEPLSAIAWKYGIDEYPASYLARLWNLLYQSHAHDSVHGLGPRTLVEGELSRLRQAGLISSGLERRALQNITKEIDTSGIGDTEFFLAVHNPSPFMRSGVVEAFIDLPREISLDRLLLEDMEGNPVPLQEVDRRKTKAGVYHPRSRNMPFPCTRVHAYFMASRVPALGYRTFKIKWVAKSQYPYPHEDWEERRIPAESLLSGPNQAENEYIRVAVSPDGSLTVTDKATGAVHAGLNYFMDCGDRGNMWMHDPPGSDRVINSLGSRAEVAVTVHGPLAVKLSVRLRLPLPASFDWARQRRSETERELPIRVEITLRKGCRHLELETVFDNTVRDHFLKACFPTGLKAAMTWAEGSFTVSELPAAPSKRDGLRGDELARHPAHLWFDLSDGKRGLAVLPESPRDYEVLEHDGSGTLAMGLVRGVRLRIPCDNRLWMEYPGDESAQSLGVHRSRYALLPHAGLWDEAGLHGEALAFGSRMRVCQFGRQKGRLPLEKSGLEIQGEGIVLSALKKAEDRASLIVRLFNPGGREAGARLVPGFPCVEAHLCTMNEERLRPLDVRGGAVELEAGRGKILTVELV